MSKKVLTTLSYDDIIITEREINRKEVQKHDNEGNQRISITDSEQKR